MQNQDNIIIGPFRFKKSKSIFLQKERGTSFENLILDGKIIESIQSTNPDYNGQKMLIINYKNYPWCIPYRKKEDEDGVFFELATAFPRRTLKKQYPHIFTL